MWSLLVYDSLFEICVLHTIKQLEWSEILSEGTFVIFSLTRRGMLYNVFNKFFAKMVLQYGNNAPSEMVSSYCVTHNKNS